MMPLFLLLSLVSYGVLAHGYTFPLDSEDESGVFLLQQRSTFRKSRPKRSTAVFVAGLEGSGHHLWDKLVRKLYRAQGNGTLPFQLKDTWFPQTFFDSSTGVERTVTWQCQFRWNRDDMDLGVELFENITNHVGHVGGEDYDEDTIWATPTCLSYPCGHGTYEEKRDDFIPRVDWVAEAAALAGVNLNVGLLYRPFEDLLMSNCIHRQLEESCDQSADTLIANAGALLGQLRAIEAMPDGQRPLVQCLRYADMTTLPQGLTKMFNHKMSFDPLLRIIWKPNAYDQSPDQHYGENPRDVVPNWDELLDSLRPLDAELNAACERADQAM